MVNPSIDRQMGRVIPWLCGDLKNAPFLQHQHLCVFLMSRHNLLSILPWPTGKGWYYSTFCCFDPQIFCFWRCWPIPVKINKRHWKCEEIGQKREEKRSALPSEVNSGQGLTQTLSPAWKSTFHLIIALVNLHTPFLAFSTRFGFRYFLSHRLKSPSNSFLISNEHCLAPTLKSRKTPDLRACGGHSNSSLILFPNQGAVL